jgi:hypothetical protein
MRARPPTRHRLRASWPSRSGAPSELARRDNRRDRWFACAARAALAISALLASSAQAQDARVVQRLMHFGELSSPAARSLQATLTKRMHAAAKRRPEQDAVARAMSLAVSAPQAGKSSAESAQPKPEPLEPRRLAEAKRRLRAGLDLWALEKFFSPQRGFVQTCAEPFELNAAECDALIAAASQETRAAALARRKADYLGQREAHLARRLAEMKARRARLLTTVSGEPVRRGPQSRLEAEVAGLSPDAVDQIARDTEPAASAAAASKTQPKAGAKSALVPAEPVLEADAGLLEELVTDPLGKSAAPAR